MSVLRHAFNSYARNWKLISFFSIPFLIAFLIPLLSPMPSYVSLGATFLRTGSMFIDLTAFDILVIVVSSLVSLFLICFAVIAINIVIKSQRSLTKIRKEVIDGIEKYTLNLFWMWLIALLACLIVNILSYEYGLGGIIGPAFAFLVSLPLFYAPAAMVMDELRPYRAMQASISLIFKLPMYFLIWLAIAFILLTLLDAISLALVPILPWARYIALVLNSLFLLPFLVVLQSQTFISKYAIVGK